MEQADFVFPAEARDTNQLAEQEKRDQQQFQAIVFNILNNPPVVGQPLCNREKIPVTVYQDSVYVLEMFGAWVSINSASVPVSAFRSASLVATWLAFPGP